MEATQQRIEFTVYGRPAQMGSKRAFVAKGRAVMVNDNSERLRQWYNAVASAAAEKMQGRQLFEGPLQLSVQFRFKRPKSHYGTGRNAGKLKQSAPDHHIQKPDMDKLMRCLKDALSSVVWRDDCQVCFYDDVGKWWTSGQECAEIVVEEIA